MAVQLITTALASAAAQQCTYRTVRETFTTGSCEYAAAPTSTTSRAPPVRRCNSTYVNASSIVDGWLVEGRSRSFIGTYTSQLQAYIDDAYAPITKADYENVSLVNSTVLRHLRLRGNYSCDAPLLLPSMFVLKAEGTTIVPASNLTLHNVSRFSALVMLVNVTLSAVVGGTYDASSLPLSPDYPKYTRGYHALSIHGDNSGGKNTIRNVRALANNTGASIGVNEVSHAEVSFSDIGGGAEHGMLNTRCVWTLSVTAALIHDNFIRNCSKHSLDFDAYTSGSAAYSNVIEDHGEEGIFVEETASGACARARGSLPWTPDRIYYTHTFAPHVHALAQATSFSTTRSAARTMASVSTQTRWVPLPTTSSSATRSKTTSVAASRRVAMATWSTRTSTAFRTSSRPTCCRTTATAQSLLGRSTQSTAPRAATTGPTTGSSETASSIGRCRRMDRRW